MSTNEECIRDATGLARETVSDGNTPFGSLLVVGDTVVRWSKNTTMTENDITAHPELKLARWAAREFDPDDLANGTMYTSTEPCEMCATAIHYAGLNRVVCSVSGEALADVQEEASGIFCRDVVRRKGGATEVDGPVLETEGIRLHEAVHK